MAESDLLELLREARPHLVQADPETENYLGRLEERHDELLAYVERMFADDPAAAGWPRCERRRLGRPRVM